MMLVGGVELGFSRAEFLFRGWVECKYSSRSGPDPTALMGSAVSFFSALLCTSVVCVYVCIQRNRYRY